MSAQYGSLDQAISGAPINRKDPWVRRIALGVFLGLIAWTIVMAVIGAILAATLLSSVEDSFNDDTSTSSSTTPDDSGANLSAPCKAVIDQGVDTDGTSAECDGDDTTAILEYLATK